MAIKPKTATAYIRVSGKGQNNGVGFDRQIEAIKAYAKTAGYKLLDTYREIYTGTEAQRPVFNDMLRDLLTNGCQTIIVESLDRFARDLGVQIQLIALLISRDLTLIAANTGRNITADMKSDPMLKAMVQVQGVFSELDKSLIVKKLQTARNKIRQDKGRCEGRKPFGYYAGERETLQRIKQLNRKPKGGKRLGPYCIARILNQEGLPTRTGKPWSGVVVKRICKTP